MSAMILRRSFLKSAVSALIFPTVIKFEAVANVLAHRVPLPAEMPPLFALIGPKGDYTSLSAWKAAWQRYNGCDLSSVSRTIHAVIQRGHNDPDLFNPDITGGWRTHYQWPYWMPSIELDPMNLYGLQPQVVMPRPHCIVMGEEELLG